MRLTLLTLIVLAACGSPAGPNRIDPTVMVTNQTPWPVTFQWRDGQGIVGNDVIPGATSRCERFDAQADSAYFYIEATDQTASTTSTYTQPWFDPTDRHAWKATVSPNSPGSPSIAVRQDGTVAAC